MLDLVDWGARSFDRHAAQDRDHEDHAGLQQRESKGRSRRNQADEPFLPARNEALTCASTTV